MTDDTTHDDEPEPTRTTPTADRIASLEQTVRTLAERVVELESERAADDAATAGSNGVLSRRSVLGALGIAGLAGLGVSTASADPQGQVGTQSDPLADLYTMNVQSPEDQLRFYAGGSFASVIAFDGQDPDTLVGTGHSVPNTSAGRTVAGGASHTLSNEFSTVSGGFGNEASGYLSTVGGGRSHEASDHYTTVGGGTGNTASFSRSTVAGGGSNTADGGGATVGGGTNNLADGYQSTVAGGGHRDQASEGNAAYTNYSTVGGGTDNQAGTDGQINVDVAATVGGGEGNMATGDYATIPGGTGNRATEPHSFAAGTNAHAAHEGAFVWCDTSSGGLGSARPNEFAVSASGGTVFFSNEGATTGVELSSGSGSWSSASSRTLKSDVDPVSGEAVLEQVTDLEISRWTYDSQPGVRHMGPMAEAFHDAFGLGDDEESISTVDADGVALGAIQGLAERLEDTAEQLAESEARVEALEDSIGDRDERIDELEGETDELRDRLEALEGRVDAGAPGARR